MICGARCDKQKNGVVDIKAKYVVIMERIGEAAAKSGRDPKQIKLLAASKSQTVAKIEAAVEAGVRLIGENYVREAMDKKKLIREPLEWHMIGHLQRNKARAAIETFDLIQSLDSMELARQLDREGQKRGKKVRAFVEVNLAKEETKSGVVQEELLPLLEVAGELSSLSVEGLMAVPPFRENPQDVRPFFRALRQLQVKFSGLRIPNVELRELSMGMTHDYTIAIEEGSTMVRIGTALFGPRKA